MVTGCIAWFSAAGEDGTDLCGETQGAGGVCGVTFFISAAGTDLCGETQGAGGVCGVTFFYFCSRHQSLW